MIGNTHSAALLARDGSIDWLCLPHFDSPAVFCRLLDANRGGHLRLAPLDAHHATRRYIDNTAVLETEFDCAHGRMRSTDFMSSPPLARSMLGHEDPHCHRLLRRLEGLAGTVTIELVFRPTFDYARAPHRSEAAPGGVRVVGPQENLLLQFDPPVTLSCLDDRVAARFDLRAGERVWMTLAHGGTDIGDTALQPLDPDELLQRTLRHWREWDRNCTYAGPYEAQVRASARVLKLLTFSPTGALVAAPTTSLPEQIGGVRNWDYRFCWLRDAALILHALMSIGHHGAALDFFCWLESLCIDNGTWRDDPQIMHRLDGGRDLPEQELPHLAGYCGSAPVRIGNAAAGQTQLDVYGHVLDAALVCLRGMNRPLRPGLLRVLRRFADLAAQCWQLPDHGLWEARHEPRHFLSSKLMCWVALDRAVQLAEAGPLGGDVAGWRRQRDTLRAMLLEQGYNRSVGAFTQVLGGTALDASVLLMPLVGFLPATDPRMHATVESIRRRLTRNGLVYRYTDADGLPGHEGTFAICSYWMVDNLARQGRLAEACTLFEQIGSHASDLGLMAEEIDPDRRLQLGNYPQGFTHLAQIQAALTIGRVQRSSSHPPA